MATDTQKNSTKTQKQAKAEARPEGKTKTKTKTQKPDAKAPATTKAKPDAKAPATKPEPLSRCAQLRQKYRDTRDPEQVKKLAAKLGLKEVTAKLNISAVKREERDQGK